MKGIIDRIEGAFAAVETPDGIRNIEIALLPKDIKEGSVIKLTPGGWEICRDETDQRRRFLRERTEKLFGEREK